LFDICIICALAEEAQAFLNVAEEHCNLSWTNEINLRFKYDYRFATLPNREGEPLRVHVSWPPGYGPQEMLLHLNRVIEEYQPRLAAMTGICAGDKRHVKLGDLVVAERTFTYDTGKMVKDELGQTVHQHDTTTYQVHENTLQFLRLFSDWKTRVAALSRPFSKRQQRDWLLERLAVESTRSIKAIPLAELEEHAPAWRQLVHELQQGPKPFFSPAFVLRDKAMVEHLRYGLVPFPFQDPPEALCHIRALASGSAVHSDNPFKEVQIPVRGAVAIDMEGAAFGRVMARFRGIEWLIVKGVSDYADQDKDDSYHSYAATASATYMLSFIEAYVTRERFSISSESQTLNISHSDDTGHCSAPTLLSAPSRDAFSPEVWNVSRRHNAFFTGRAQVLHQLADGFRVESGRETAPPQAITGLAGMGKTQTAAEYAYRFREDYRAVLWVRAQTQEDLIADFQTIARLLKLPQKHLEDRAILMQTMQEWFRHKEDWLLIFDNADDFALVEPFIPRMGRGHVLLTTRVGATVELAQALELQSLTVADGALCLLRRAGLLRWNKQLEDASPTHADAARELARQMNGLPLALEQAGAYMNDTKCGVIRYLDLYKQYRAKLQQIQSGIIPDYAIPVAPALMISSLMIGRTSVAFELLQLCAFLAPEGIPDQFVTLTATALGPVLSPIADDPLVLDQAIRSLVRYSLLEREEQSGTAFTTLSIHRLLQLVLLDEMDVSTRQLWAERAVRALILALQTMTWPVLQAHARQCLDHIAQWHLSVSEAEILQAYRKEV